MLKRFAIDKKIDVFHFIQYNTEPFNRPMGQNNIFTSWIAKIKLNFILCKNKILFQRHFSILRFRNRLISNSRMYHLRRKMRKFNFCEKKCELFYFWPCNFTGVTADLVKKQVIRNLQNVISCSLGSQWIYTNYYSVGKLFRKSACIEMSLIKRLKRLTLRHTYPPILKQRGGGDRIE